MPYTPPSLRSPATSAPVSPDISRRSSFHGQTNTNTNNARPVLPRSASYLTKHRRTQPAPGQDVQRTVGQPSPDATSDDLKGMMNNLSVRQSPPPVTDGSRMPAGAMLSPPESSDDELPEVRGRQIESIKALHDAISLIPQNRSTSPDKDADKADAGDLLVLPSQTTTIAKKLHPSFSTGALDGLAAGRRFSHTRSATESSLVISKSAGNSLTTSEEDSDEEILRKPQMVRKKSGELVRPALRPSSRRRPSSMPGTPTFSKAVHFDSHLEHVRHFLAVDRPQAVSAGSSPADNYESDSEYPFPADEPVSGRQPPFEWEIVVTNYPLETPARKAQAVRLERVWLSHDGKSLIGSVAVANFAFHKTVTCRFTLDYWKTTSEVAAEYICEIRPKETPEGCDRFNFTIKLSDLANLETKTLYFCIRYNVNGQEYWDNNNGTNFQVDFKKNQLPMNGKKGMTGASGRTGSGLPKSHRRSNQPSKLNKSSMPAMDEFGGYAKLDQDHQSLHDYLGETEPIIRLKGVKSSGNIPSDNLSGRLPNPTGQAFANRYNFGASLAAINSPTRESPTSDGLYMKAHRRPTTPSRVPTLPVPTVSVVSPVPSPSRTPVAPKSNATPIIQAPAPKPATTMASVAPAAITTTPATNTANGTDSPASASISSSSYEELVNKYCFFGTAKGQPRFDGADDASLTASTTSPAGSPTQMPSLQHQPQQGFTVQQYQIVRPQAVATVTAPNTQRIGSPSTGQGSRQAPSESLSPTSMMGGFQSFGGASPNEFPYQQLHDRFPFSSPETHSPTAIRG